MPRLLPLSFRPSTSLLWLLLTGCDVLDFLDSGDPWAADPCTADGASPAWVAGDWALTGQGERTGCSVASLDTPRFELASRGAIQVAQDGSQLLLANTRADFRLQGSVEGVCVDFTTTESDNTLSFDWTGIAQDNVVTGTFTGYGPGACLSEGDFTLLIDPLEEPTQ